MIRCHWGGAATCFPGAKSELAVPFGVALGGVHGTQFFRSLRHFAAATFGHAVSIWWDVLLSVLVKASTFPKLETLLAITLAWNIERVDISSLNSAASRVAAVTASSDLIQMIVSADMAAWLPRHMRPSGQGNVCLYFE